MHVGADAEGLDWYPKLDQNFSTTKTRNPRDKKSMKNQRKAIRQTETIPHKLEGPRKRYNFH